jgi:hypothetical protein
LEEKKEKKIEYFTIPKIEILNADYIIYFDSESEFMRQAQTFDDIHIYVYNKDKVFMAGSWVYWLKHENNINKTE